MRYTHRPEMLTSPTDRLPVEIQDSLGFRFMSQLPAGPMREAVEGYLAMPANKRGAGTFALKIVIAAVRSEQERQRASRGAVGRFMGVSDEADSDEGATLDVATPDDGVAPLDTLDETPTAPSELSPSGEATRLGHDDPGAESASMEHDPASRYGQSPQLQSREEAAVAEPEARPEQRVMFEFADAGQLPTGETDEVPLTSGFGAAGTRWSVRSPGNPGSRARRGPTQPYQLAHAREDLATGQAGWSTGFPELDAWGLRFVPGRLVLVHGPPGGGKTAFLLELMRRYAESERGVVYVANRESRGEVFARLLMQETARQSLLEAEPSLPSGPVVRDWIRDPSTVPAEEAESLTRAAARIDELSSKGALSLQAGPAAGSPGGGWAGEMIRMAETHGPSLVLVDDAGHLIPAPASGAPSPEVALPRIVRLLNRVALGRGAETATPVVFSVPFPPTFHVIPRLGAVLRVDDKPDGSGFRISVEKNGMGPRGGSVEISVFGGSATR